MSRGKKISLGSVVIYIVLGFWALTTIYPIFWVIINSFKAKGEILRIPLHFLQERCLHWLTTGLHLNASVFSVHTATV